MTTLLPLDPTQYVEYYADDHCDEEDVFFDDGAGGDYWSTPAPAA